MSTNFRRSKYGVRTDAKGKEDRTVDGIVFHSKRECKRYLELQMLVRAGYITNLQLQPPFALMVNNVKVGTYKADFAYTDQRGTRCFEDAKGYRTAEYELKKKIVEAQYGIRIVEV